MLVTQPVKFGGQRWDLHRVHFQASGGGGTPSPTSHLPPVTDKETEARVRAEATQRVQAERGPRQRVRPDGGGDWPPDRPRGFLAPGIGTRQVRRLFHISRPLRTNTCSGVHLRSEEAPTGPRLPLPLHRWGAWPLAGVPCVRAQVRGQNLHHDLLPQRCQSLSEFGLPHLKHGALVSPRAGSL